MAKAQRLKVGDKVTMADPKMVSAVFIIDLLVGEGENRLFGQVVNIFL